MGDSPRPAVQKRVPLSARFRPIPSFALTARSSRAYSAGRRSARRARSGSWSDGSATSSRCSTSKPRLRLDVHPLISNAVCHNEYRLCAVFLGFTSYQPLILQRLPSPIVRVPLVSTSPNSFILVTFPTGDSTLFPVEDALPKPGDEITPGWTVIEVRRTTDDPVTVDDVPVTVWVTVEKSDPWKQIRHRAIHPPSS